VKDLASFLLFVLDGSLIITVLLCLYGFLIEPSFLGVVALWIAMALIPIVLIGHLLWRSSKSADAKNDKST
jgi:hypothetical protein